MRFLTATSLSVIFILQSCGEYSNKQVKQLDKELDESFAKVYKDLEETEKMRTNRDSHFLIEKHQVNDALTKVEE